MVRLRRSIVLSLMDSQTVGLSWLDLEKFWIKVVGLREKKTWIKLVGSRRRVQDKACCNGTKFWVKLIRLQKSVHLSLHARGKTMYLIYDCFPITLFMYVK